MSEFPKRLKRCMDFRGKTQTDIAVNCGIDKGNLSHYLKGDFEPKYSTIKKIADYLDVSVAFLMGLTNSIIDPVIRPLNTLGEKSEKEIVIDEITANLTWLDIDTLRNLNAMVKAITKDKK